MNFASCLLFSKNFLEEIGRFDRNDFSLEAHAQRREERDFDAPMEISIAQLGEFWCIYSQQASTYEYF